MVMEPDEIISELLHEILYHLEPHDLLNCRLVNREWNHVSCKYLKQRCESIQLLTEANLNDFISTAMAINDSDFPFSRIHMTVSNFLREDVILFAATFGSHVREYDLDLDFTGSTSCLTYYDAVEKVGILLKSSPNVEILRIKDENIEMDFTKFRFKEYFPAVLPRLHVLEIQIDQLLRQSLGTKIHFGLLHQLVQITPALQHFVIHFIGNGFWNSQLSNLLIAMQHVPRISLVNLSIRTDDVRRGNMQSLVAIQCQIQELSLVIMNSTCNPQVLFRLLYDWLEVDGQTLVKLQLKTDNVGFCIPYLKNLKILDLNLSKKWEISENMFLQRFLPEQFPKLEEVSLCSYSEIIDHFSTGIFPTVTSLTLDSYQEEVIKEPWDQIFPNLRKLKLLRAIPNHLSFVLVHLPYIRNLVVEFNTEKAPDTDVARVLSGTVSESPPIPTGVNGFYYFPSLTNMQRLQRLELRNCGSHTLNTLVSLSSTGQFHGISTLKCLLAKQQELTNPEVEAQLAKFHDRVVIRNGTTRIY